MKRVAMVPRWFKNKNTGVEWAIGDPVTLKRVLEDPQTYEEIKPAEKKGKE